MKEKQSYPKIRGTFPQVYRTPEGYMVSARQRKWGLKIRKTFPTESEALQYREQILKSIQDNGAQPTIPKDKLALVGAYERLTARLLPFSKTPEDAVDHYVKFLGDQIVRQAMPTIAQLVEQFQAHKLIEKHDDQYRNEIKVHCKFIKVMWGDMRADEMRKNEIETTLTKRFPNRNTRRKYLTFSRMFFNWVLGEDKGYLVKNPTLGITFRAEAFEKEYYLPETLKNFFQQIAEKFPELIGYYSLLTFAGLRPSEGGRVQWRHINFKTNELHVIKGKTDARHIHLEPVAIEWLKWFREQSPKDAAFIPQRNLFNLEREARELMPKWIADGLRHTFATYYTTLKKDYPAVAWYMGNSVSMIKKHYAQTIPSEMLNEFWSMTPSDAIKAA